MTKSQIMAFCHDVTQNCFCGNDVAQNQSGILFIGVYLNKTLELISEDTNCLV